MNKKQLIVAWAMGILVVLSILFPMWKITDYIDALPSLKTYAFEQIGIILIIGGLLIYTLRDKKK